MNSKGLSIIIVNYNLSTEVDQCITSLFAHVKSIPYEVIVVDNASVKAERDLLLERYAENKLVKFVWNEDNLGFGRACNIGLASSVGEIACFLNPDTMLNSDIFAQLVPVLEDEHIAIVGPGMTTRGKFLDFSAGFQPNLFLETLNVVFAGRHLEALLVTLLVRMSHTPYIRVGWVLGACLIIRRNVFLKLGGFDVDYFLFFEEVDLCRRAIQQGYSVGYMPGSKLFHAGSVSVKRDYQAFTKHYYQSKLRFIESNFIGPTRLLFRYIVKLQLYTQFILWQTILLLYSDKEKAKQKLLGIQAVSR